MCNQGRTHAHGAEVPSVQSLTLQSSTKHTGLEPVDLSSTNDKTLAEFGLKIKQRSTQLNTELRFF